MKWKVFRSTQTVGYPGGARLTIKHWVAMRGNDYPLNQNGYIFTSWRQAFDFAYNEAKFTRKNHEDYIQKMKEPFIND